MELRSIPLSKLDQGHRLLLNGSSRYGTIEDVDLEKNSLTILMDDSVNSITVKQDDLSEQLVYMGYWAMYCVVSMAAVKLMNGNRGKLGAQCAHGFQFAEWDSQERFPLYSTHYRKSWSSKKVCLKADDQADLIKYKEIYANICGVALIRDAGKTVFKEPTVTVLGIGPIRIDEYGDMRDETLKQAKVLI